MVDAILAKIFGTRNEREVKSLRPRIEKINALEPSIQQLSDIDLAAKTIDFRERLERGATLDDILEEAFAVVREAGRRVLNMRHFDVQLIGGMVLHKGCIAEMKTGEGKTLVATAPVYLNALAGDVRSMAASDDPDLAWVRESWKSLDPDPRVPLVGGSR